MSTTFAANRANRGLNPTDRGNESPVLPYIPHIPPIFLCHPLFTTEYSPLSLAIRQSVGQIRNI